MDPCDITHDSRGRADCLVIHLDLEQAKILHSALLYKRRLIPGNSYCRELARELGEWIEKQEREADAA